jgi:hypothetical protein
MSRRILQVYNEQNEKLGEVIVNDAGEPQGVVIKMSTIGAFVDAIGPCAFNPFPVG